MSLLTIVLSIIIVAAIGVMVYFIVKNILKISSPAVNSDKPILLRINVGSIETKT
jgi:uncharacterized protein (UPF0333 family)